MALKIEGVEYLQASEVAETAGVSRQTLWRWRRNGRIPIGRKYRDRQVLFTSDEVEEIRNFAHRMETPEDLHEGSSLFDNKRKSY